MTESERIADQLVRAFDGETWTGRSVHEIVAALTPAQAATHPVAGAHSAWELLAHIAAWLRVSRIRLGGQAYSPTEEENFPPVTDSSEQGWQTQWRQVEDEYRALADAIRRFPPEHLETPVAGKPYPVYHLLHGVIQHSLYHAGQIALVARLVRGAAG